MMNTNLYEERYLNIFVDEKKNIAIFSQVRNPEYDINDEESLMYVFAKHPLELQYPYTQEKVAEIIKESIGAWDQGEPYIDNKTSIEEYYYDIKGFKKATHKKRLISVGWDDIGGKQVCLYVAMKSKKYYMGLTSIKLSDDADWSDFAKVVIEYINADITQIDAFKTYKNKLNY